MDQFWRIAALSAVVWGSSAYAAEDSGSGTRHGAFGLLDSRSTYGSGWFPEPLRAPEMDVDDEIRLDWQHSEKAGLRADELTLELEKSFGLLTVEVEVPYEREVEQGSDPASGVVFRERSEGIGSIEVAARHPVFQAVSPERGLDYTLAAALEVAIPTDSEVGKDGEVVPKLFHLLRVGDHFSAQASVGYSVLVGPEDTGKQTLEYALVLGWAVEHEDLPIPAVSRLVPLLELVGERGLNNGDHENVLTGTAGVRINLDSFEAIQPRLGLGYVFPIDDGGRDELRWGVVTSLVFEF